MKTYISTGHHDSIALLDNLLQIVIEEAGGFFNLGHDGGFERPGRKLFVNQGLDFVNVGRSLDKGKGDPVDSNGKHVFQVTAILGCQRTDFENRIGRVDPLAVLDLSRDFDEAIEVVGSLFRNCEFDFPVVHQQVVANFGGLDNFGVGELDALVVAFRRVRVQAKDLTRDEGFTRRV